MSIGNLSPKSVALTSTPRFSHVEFKVYAFLQLTVMSGSNFIVIMAVDVSFWTLLVVNSQCKTLWAKFTFYYLN